MNEKSILLAIALATAPFAIHVSRKPLIRLARRGAAWFLQRTGPTPEAGTVPPGLVVGSVWKARPQCEGLRSPVRILTTLKPRNLEPMVVFQDMEPGSAVLGLTPVGTFQQCFEFEAIAAFDEVLS